MARVPLIYGVGLNYSKHIAESGYPTPEYPSCFTKPPDALNGPYSDVHVVKDSIEIDYEGGVYVCGRQRCQSY